jgi:hypothetical protein
MISLFTWFFEINGGGEIDFSMTLTPLILGERQDLTPQLVLKSS